MKRASISNKGLFSLLFMTMSVVLFFLQFTVEGAPGVRLNDIIIEVLDSNQGMQGDCDGDEQLTVADAICALKMSVGLMPEKRNLEMTEDGQVTSGDARAIIQRIP